MQSVDEFACSLYNSLQASREDLHGINIVTNHVLVRTTFVQW